MSTFTTITSDLGIGATPEQLAHIEAIIRDLALDTLEQEWISGFGLARDASLLIHDGQYADTEYPEHLGWGHSSLSHALSFARRTGVERTVLFHHDPLHTDEQLDRLGAEARESWAAAGGDPAAVELAVEGAEIEVRTAAPSVA